jgi:tripartite-type tricarboxylate transporter receptor subunit TctC
LKTPRKNLISMLMILMMSGLVAACATTTTTPPAATPAPVNFPTKPMKLIITHSAGGSTDLVPRMLAPYLQQHLGGNPVVVENTPGAGGNIARAFIYNAPADGYTLLVSQFPSMIIGELVNNGNFKTTEMSAVAQLTGRQTQALVVPTNHPAQDYAEWVEYSKTNRVTMSGLGLAVMDT